MFVKGYRWKVGNDNHIKIGTDPWLKRKEERMVRSSLESLKEDRVSSLIREEGGWNEKLIKELFSDEDAEEILKIPLGSKNAMDEIMWAEHLKGSFSVKTAYHLAIKQEEHRNVSCSDNSKI